MKKIKKLFSTPRRAIISAVVTVAVLAIAGTGITYAVTSKTWSKANYTIDQAKEIALSDAGVNESDANFTKAVQEIDDGMLLYDLEFYANATEYDYEINAVTGEIYNKEIDGPGAVSSSDAQAEEPVDNSSDSSASTSSSSSGSSDMIDVETAKSIALKKAGLSESDVTFKKAKLDRDDGLTVYEIEFYYNGTEYEFEIDAYTSEIISYDKDND